jgi:hypothetical protein
MMMEAVTDEEILTSLRGAQSWITPALIRETLDTLQPYYTERMSADEALEILNRMGQLFELLTEEPRPQPPESVEMPPPGRRRAKRQK